MKFLPKFLTQSSNSSSALRSLLLFLTDSSLPLSLSNYTSPNVTEKHNISTPICAGTGRAGKRTYLVFYDMSTFKGTSSSLTNSNCNDLLNYLLCWHFDLYTLTFIPDIINAPINWKVQYGSLRIQETMVTYWFLSLPSHCTR